MREWTDSFLNLSLSIAIILAVATIAAVITPRLIRRLSARRRGRVEIVFEPWADLRNQEGLDQGRSVGDLLLFEIRNIQRVHSQTVNRVAITNTYQDVPTFTDEVSEDIALLASTELEAEAGRLTAIAILLLRLMPFLSPQAELHGSLHQHGERRQLHATLDGFEPKNRAPRTRWAVRIRSTPEGQRKTKDVLAWKVVNERPTDANLPDDVQTMAYKIYLDLIGDTTFKTWDAFALFTEGLEQFLKWMDLRRSEDLEGAESAFQAALRLESKNELIHYNLGVLLYMKYRPEYNEEALDQFRLATSADNPRLRARANAGLANCYLMRWHRYNDKSPKNLSDARRHGEDAVRACQDLDSANKSLAWAHHMFAEHLAESDAQSGSGKVRDHRTLAKKYYLRAVKLNPWNHVAHNNLGHLYLDWARAEPERRQRYLRDSMIELDKSINIDHGYAFAHDNRGNVYLEQGEIRAARDAFEDALRCKPDYPEALNDLAMLALHPDFEEAEMLPTGIEVRVADSIGRHIDAIEAANAASERACDGQSARARYASKLCRAYSAAMQQLVDEESFDDEMTSLAVEAKRRGVHCRCAEIVGERCAVGSEGSG